MSVSISIAASTRFSAAAALLMALLPGSRLPAETLLLRASKVYPVSGPPIANGQVVVREGKITEVGAQVSVDPSSPDVRVLDVAGSLIPGLIDCSSDIGVSGRAVEEYSELTPEVRALEAVDFSQLDFKTAFAEGVTVVCVSAGARNVIGGLGAVVRTAPKAQTLKAAVLKRDAFLDVSLSDEASAGNANLRFNRPSSYIFRLPNTRMGTVFMARRAFFEALGLDREEEPLLSKASPLPVLPVSPVSPASPLLPTYSSSGFSHMLEPEGKEVLRGALRGKVPIRIHADERQEILAALKIADEFHTPIQIVGGAEAMDVIPELLSKKTVLLLDPGTNGREDAADEHPNYTARLPELLSKAGVPFAFCSRSGRETPYMRSRVALNLRFGLDEAKALEGLTLGAARILGISDRLGSIEPGKEANLAAIAGTPFDVSAPVLWVLSNGQLAGPVLKQEKRF